MNGGGGGGGGVALNHLPLLFCKSVYCLSFLKLGTNHYPPPPPHRDWGKIVCMKKIAEINCLLRGASEKNCLQRLPLLCEIWGIQKNCLRSQGRKKIASVWTMVEKVFCLLQSVSWILAEFYFNRGLQRLYTGTCIILQKTINGFLCLLIVFLESKTYQLILKDVIKLNRNLR